MPVGPRNINPRYSEHKPSVQQLPPTSPLPKKRFGHQTKYGRTYTPSGVLRGVVNPIFRRFG